MLNQFLLNILITVVAFNFLIGGIYIVFLVNARIILKTQFTHRQFEIKTVLAAQQASSSDEAAQQLRLTTEEFVTFCYNRSIDTPEQRKEKKDQAEKRKQDDLRRISEDEALWRAEQEKMVEQLRLKQDEETNKRKERIRKFGIA